MRKLDANFIYDLTCDVGKLNGLLNYIRCDNTLDLEIRENYINVYYRGGNALDIKTNPAGGYFLHFDYNYLNYSTLKNNDMISNALKNNEWNIYFPLVKQAMDFYFTESCKEEREFQQLVIRENNYSTFANSTDYFIIDIEYNNHKNARFDMVGLEWKSNASDRKLVKNCLPKLVLIEMKYGDGALNGEAGIKKHINDYEKFMTEHQDILDFKTEMIELFSQKRQLGLIPCLNNNKNTVTQVADEIDLLFLIANHDPASSILKSILSEIENRQIKFIASNFMGYGLFKENIFSYNEFVERYQYGVFNDI